MPGYKQTDVGVIPVEWGVARFSELFEFRNGVNADKGAYGRGIQFINVLEVITKGHLRAPDIPGKVSLTKSAIDSYAVRRGDLLFNRTSETQEEVGLTAVYLDDEPVVFGGFVIRGRPRTAAVDVSFSGYAFRAPSIRSQIIARGQGAIRANVGQGDLRQILTALPPLPEQRVIAQALSDADALIESLEQLLAKKRHLKQGAMQELLTGKKRLPGFSGEWEAKRLGDLAEMGSGGTPPSINPAFYDGDIPWVSISDMTKCGKLISTTDRNLSAAGLNNSSAQMCPAGTVLYAMYASLGECSIAGVPLCSSQAILGIKAKSSLDNEFLYYFMTSIRARVKTMGQQGTQANLNKGMVQGFHLRLPPRPEQTAIAAILSDMDAEIAALEAKLAKARALKQGMMQELLTGRIRLV